MVYKNKKSRTAIPGYTLIPNGDHHQIRKISLTSERLKTDPAYHITRLHTMEFAMAAKFGKLIRSALLPGTGIKNKAAPLTAVLLKALQADKETPLGQRDFRTADFTSLIGFNCNEEAALGDCLSVDMEVELLHTETQTRCHIPSFMPAQAIHAPEGITHARIIAITAIIDMEQHSFEKQVGKTTIMPLKQIKINRQTITVTWPPGKDQLVIAAVGIKWYQQERTGNKITASRVPGPLSMLKVQKLMP
jgi:hypothetical protein